MQIHYDFTKNRKYVTTTLEMYKPDEYGATFWFADFDYNDNIESKSISLAYWEIARYLTIPSKTNLSASIQYNDGVMAGVGGLGSIWLTGLSYSTNYSGFNLSSDLLFRKKGGNNGFQLTFVWFRTLLQNKLVISGYFDYWVSRFDSINDYVVLTEPQIWYNINNRLMVGSEIEISKNFLQSEDIKIYPTIAFKWTF